MPTPFEHYQQFKRVAVFAKELAKWIEAPQDPSIERVLHVLDSGELALSTLNEKQKEVRLVSLKNVLPYLKGTPEPKFSKELIEELVDDATAENGVLVTEEELKSISVDPWMLDQTVLMKIVFQSEVVLSFDIR